MELETQRYRSDRSVFESLKDNPLQSPAQRGVNVYLPPGYFENPRGRYPTVYLLHGYGRDSNNPMVDSIRGLRRTFPLMLRILFPKIFARLLTYEKLDRLIASGSLPPFILVQPDASLHRPNIHGIKALDGRVGSKGSLYTDSPFSGRYAAYVFEELVGYVDEHYRTIAEKGGRYLMGGSMGAYGTLLGGILYPDRFQAIAALSPSISCLDLLDARLIVPLNQIVFGKRKAERLGRREIEDILDTCDLVYSHDRRLVPSLVRDENGHAVEMDEGARQNWLRSDLAHLLDSHPDAFRGVRVLFNCDEHDEFGFAAPCRRFHALLNKRGIEHGFEIYEEPKARRISPHALGIAWHILPALRFCLRRQEA